MKIATSIWTGVALLAMAQTAQAVPPKPTGKFAFMLFNQCEAKINTTTANTYLKDGGGTDIAVRTLRLAPQIGVGGISVNNGYITFSPSAVGSSSGNVLLSGQTLVEGGSLRVNNDGRAMTSGPQPNINGTYSFTDTTFTITIPGEGAQAFAMTHANNSKTFYLVRREDARCLTAITATRVAP